MSRPVAVVTGASRGIGKRFCIDLAKRGYDVVATARSSDDSRGKLPGTVEETAALARKEGAQALAVSLDVRDEAAIAKLADHVYEVFGRCDLVVNNAALAPPKAALDDSTKRWRLGVDVNVNGPFYFAYYFAPRMAEAGRRPHREHLVGGSRALPSFGRASYTTTKAALEAMTQSLGHDLKKRRVAVNCIRLDLAVWTEGFADTLPAGHRLPCSRMR